MTYTLATMRAAIREVLIDQAQWRDTSLDQWIADALQDYSNHFPRIVFVDITVPVNPSVYGANVFNLYDEVDIPLVIQGIVSVCYPATDIPQRFLYRVDEEDSRFTSGGPYYTIRYYGQYMYLVLAETPTAGQHILVGYLTGHQTIGDTGKSNIFTFPDEHVDVIKSFVIWKALQQLELDENVSVERKAVVMNGLGLNAFRAERSYRQRIADLKKQSAISQTAPWRLDKHDRTY